MSELLTSCLLCSQPGPFDEFFVYRHKVRPTLYWELCPSCGAVFANPRPTQAELDGYYKAEYRQQVAGNSSPQLRNLNEELLRANRLHWFLRRFVYTIERHLDIGSSAGLLLAEIQHDYGCDAYAVEPGDEFREFADTQVKVAGGLLHSYAHLEDLPDIVTFDLISMSHVLEHLTDPVGYLTHLVQRHLRSDGHLLIEVPYVFGEPTALIYPHLIAFSQETLQQTLERAGLSVLVMETSQPGGRNHVSPPTYLTTIARKGVIPKEDYVRWYKATIHEHIAAAKIKQQLVKAEQTAQPVGNQSDGDGTEGHQNVADQKTEL